ncbi:MAG: hypothetical protein Q4A58_00430 [Fusobacterium sp.]|uniref:hypothetical protein n=1 Tax=Fusobacterium sp. TaxID=68766 RepID=UPI0026DBDF84|nr:hypothetical protein [Fusobacterium sp.]MDO4689754.1 hypothetical protein [Fusobacterium sp.]
MEKFVMSRFKKYLEQLKKLDIKNSFFNIYQTSEKVVMILSGSSCYETAALSEEQKEFLSIFKKYGYDIVESNFPYNLAFPYKNYVDENLIKASYVTAIYYIHTLKNREFQNQIKKHLEGIFKLKKVIIITQSSGLNVLNRFLDFFEEEDFKATDIKVFSLGPVAKETKKLKMLDYTIIKGKYDEYSRGLDCHKTDVWLKCRHLGYLKNKELLKYIEEYLEDNL